MTPAEVKAAIRAALAEGIPLRRSAAEITDALHAAVKRRPPSCMDEPPVTVSNLEIKALVRFRDCYRCVECGMTAVEHVKRFGKNLAVHRLIPGAPYRISEAVTLCVLCHAPKPKIANRRPVGRPRRVWLETKSRYWCTTIQGKRVYLDRDREQAEATLADEGKLAALLARRLVARSQAKPESARLGPPPAKAERARPVPPPVKPWLHARSGYWCVFLGGRRHYLDRDREQAEAKLVALLSAPWQERRNGRGRG
jgi:hypothetical protein